MRKYNLILIALLTCVLVFGQDKEVVITPVQVTENIFMLKGKGGNIGVLTGAEGTIMIDDQFADMAPKITTALEALGAGPVKYLINTHWHGDHTGGNEVFAEKGATIIAHDNVYKRLSMDQIRPFGRTTEASPEGAWPKLTFDSNMTIHANDEETHLLHNHNAHTDGDAFVYFSKANVLHMGDTFFAGRFPFIDMDMGGTPDGLISAVEAAMLLCDADTKIIPGHGELSNKDDLRVYLQMLKIMRDRVKQALENGTAEDALDIVELTKGYETWGTGFISGEKIVKVLYRAYSE